MILVFPSFRSRCAGAGPLVRRGIWRGWARWVAPQGRPAAWLVVLLALLTGLAGGTPVSRAVAAAPDAEAATTLVERYQAALLDVMRRARALGIQGRARELAAPVRETFDFARMARVAAGRAWREADDTARAAMVEAFARYSVAVHADRFDGYSGETFVLDGTAPGPGEALLVNTRIDRPRRDDVTLSYVVADQGDQGPRVVDVLMNGSISEVALRRSEWAAIGKQEGLDGLAQALQALTDRLLAEDTAARTD